MGISASVKTKAKASLKLSNAIRSYLFEQECGELERVSVADKEQIKKALSVLDKIVKNSK